MQYIPTLAAVPFALYGIYIHIKLFTLVPVFRAISSQPGYPDFMPPLNREMLSKTERADGKQEASSSEDTEKDAAKDDTKADEAPTDDTAKAED